MHFFTNTHWLTAGAGPLSGAKRGSFPFWLGRFEIFREKRAPYSGRETDVPLASFICRVASLSSSLTGKERLVP